MSKRKLSKKAIDAMVSDLAEHFLGGIKGVLPEDKNELADAIQELCEERCREIEDDKP